MNDAADYIREYEQLRGDSEVYRTHWQDVARLTLPSRDFYNEWYAGSKRNARIFDTTAMYACEQLAGSLHSLLTSPSQKWFKLVVADRETTLEESQWLDNASTVLYGIFNSQEGRFNSEVHEMYSELSAFGNGVFYSSSRKGRIRFKSYPLASCVGQENSEGIIDTVYRSCKSTVSGVVDFFGIKNVPETISKRLAKEPYGEVRFLHVVKPNMNYKSGSRSEKPFSSCYVDMDSKKKLGTEKGYDTMPYQWPRFSKRSGETYGFGPGMAAFPDTRMINRIMEVTIRGAEKMVDPPLLVPSDSVIGPLTINPGGIINYDPTQDPISPLAIGGNLNVMDAIIQPVKKRIMQHFYVDWLGADSDQKTEYMKATVSNNLQQKNLQQLGPLLSRLNTEFTGPLITRVFGLALEEGFISPAPESLRGTDYTVEYISPMAQAQRSADLDSIFRSLQLGIQLAGVDPSVMDNYDLDEIVRLSSLEINYIPPRLMRDIDVVRKMRESRAQAQQEQQQVALEEQASKTLANSAGAAKSIAEANYGVQ